MEGLRFNVRKFLEDCETCCIDCGTDIKSTPLTKIDDGVTLCNSCLIIAREDYPDVDYDKLVKQAKPGRR